MGHWYDMHLSLQYGNTPLMVASHGGYNDCVKLLVGCGAKVDHQDEVSAFRDQPSVSIFYVPLCEEGKCK